MEPPDHSQARRGTGSVDRGSIDGDDSGSPRSSRTDPDGSTDDEPASRETRTDDRNDWVEARRRERRRERERRWEQLQFVT